jgi:hypothetical protein
MTDFDPSDPYDAASAWCCFFVCDACNACLEEFQSATVHEFGLDYYHAQGQEAQAAGWYVADAWNSEEARYIVLCPGCRRASGLALPPPEFRAPPPDAVLTICGLTARPGELPGE